MAEGAKPMQDNLTASMSIEPQPGTEATPSPFLEYLQTQQGHELASRIVALIEALQKATTEAGADQKKRELENQHKTARLGMWLQTGAITAIVITAAVLAWHGRLDGTVATLMATLFGYFLGRNVR